MNSYIIYKLGGRELVAEKFPDAFVLEENTLWVVGSKLPNSSTVTGYLTAEGEETKKTVVVRVADYYGFFDLALWQKMQFWASQS